MLWVATANDANQIPEPILSRMAVYEVPVPTAEQARLIGRNVYQGLLREYGWPFSPELTDNVEALLEQTLPRRMRKVLLDALGNAQLENRDCLSPADFSADASAKRPMRFC